MLGAMRPGKTILKNFLSLAVSDVITKILGTALTVYAARALGATSFGQLAFAAAFVSYFNIFADLGLTSFGIREVAKNKTRTNAYATRILVLQISVSLLLLLSLTLLVNLIPLDSKTKTMILLFGLAMIPTAFDMSYLFQAHEKMEFIPWAKSVSQTVYAVLGFILIYRYQDIVFLPAANLAGLTVGSLTFYFFLKKYLKLRWSGVGLANLAATARAAIPFLTAALMIHIYSNTNILIIQFFKGPEAVGLYNAPNKIILFIVSIGGFLTWAIYPAMAKSFAKNRKRFNRLSEFSARVFGMAAIPTAVGGLILSPKIINWLYGGGWAASVPVFSVLIGLPVFIFINCVYGNALAAAGRQKISAQAVALAAALNIFLNFLFIPRYGIVAAAAVTLFTEIAEGVYLHTFAGKFLGLNILKTYFVKPLVAAVPMAMLLFLLPVDLGVLPGIICGGFIYLATLKLL